MTRAEIPLFPLQTVLFPGGYLSLRIFEQRYLTMIRDCARSNTGFGVCLILEGQETAVPARTSRIGTLATIVDWYTLEDGLLGVTAHGSRRFRLGQTREQEDGLIVGEVAWLPEPLHTALPEPFFVLSQVLGRFLDQLGENYPSHTPEQLDDAIWVGYRLSELLPLSVMEKQSLLELADPTERLQRLLEILPRFQTD